MVGRAWSRKAAEIVTPLACFFIVTVGHRVYSEREAPPDDLPERLLPPTTTPTATLTPIPPVPEPVPARDRCGGAGPISKVAVVRGMNAVRPAVADCYSAYGVPGLAMVNVVIGRNGRVSRASVSGRFAGTPTGACVEAAVKTASFPPSDGLSTPYPFMLK